MTKVNLIAFIVLILCSLALVESQYQSRKFYSDLDQAQKAEKNYHAEFGQLKLEQSTLSNDARIEAFARYRLQMQVPDEKRVQVVVLNQPASNLIVEQTKAH
jgi:cell division protein FtsL